FIIMIYSPFINYLLIICWFWLSVFLNVKIINDTHFKGTTDDYITLLFGLYIFNEIIYENTNLSARQLSIHIWKITLVCVARILIYLLLNITFISIPLLNGKTLEQDLEYSSNLQNSRNFGNNTFNKFFSYHSAIMSMLFYFYQ